MISAENDEKTKQHHTIIDLKPLEKLSSLQDNKKKILASKGARTSRSRRKDKKQEVSDTLTPPRKKRLEKRRGEGRNEQAEKRDYELRSHSLSKKKDEIIDAQNTIPMN